MDKNIIFRNIVLIYILIYAVMTSKFYKPSDCNFSNKKTLDDLQEYLIKQVLKPTMMLLIIHYAGCKFIFPIIADKVIIANKYQNELRTKRIILVSTHLFKFFCFLYLSGLGYIALHNLSWFPSEFLFGSNTENGGHITMKWLIWDRSKYKHDMLDVNTQQYFVLCTAYHLHSIIWHLINSRNAYNFYEMLLHHLVTLSLISFCFITNHTSIGVLVMILHDLTDIWSYAIKLFVNTSLKYTAFFVYLCLVISWSYYRVYVFAYAIIHPIYEEEYIERVINKKGFNEMTVYVILLSTLCLLHVFWIILFLNIGYKFISKGTVHDYQETTRREYSDTDSE